MFFEISSIASSLSFSASETGIESAAGNTNSAVFLVELLQEKTDSITINPIINNLPVIQDDVLQYTNVQKFRLPSH